MAQKRPTGSASVGATMIVAPSLDGKLRGRIDVGDREMHRPVRRHVPHLGCAPMHAADGDVAAPEDRVRALAAGAGMRGPVEQRRVERRATLDVGGQRLEPARSPDGRAVDFGTLPRLRLPDAEARAVDVEAQRDAAMEQDVERGLCATPECRDPGGDGVGVVDLDHDADVRRRLRRQLRAGKIEEHADVVTIDTDAMSDHRNHRVAPAEEP